MTGARHGNAPVMRGHTTRGDRPRRAEKTSVVSPRPRDPGVRAKPDWPGIRERRTKRRGPRTGKQQARVRRASRTSGVRAAESQVRLKIIFNSLSTYICAVSAAIVEQRGNRRNLAIYSLSASHRSFAKTTQDPARRRVDARLTRPVQRPVVTDVVLMRSARPGSARGQAVGSTLAFTERETNRAIIRSRGR